jgi:hypothetical protein
LTQVVQLVAQKLKITTLFLKLSCVSCLPDISDTLKLGIDCCVSEEQAAIPKMNTSVLTNDKHPARINKRKID